MDRRHSDWREMVPLCGFDLHFSDNEWCWACFHVFVCISSLEKCLFSSLAHFLIGSFIYTENMLLWVMSSNVYDRALWHSKTILFLPSWHSSELFFYYTSESIYCFQSHVKLDALCSERIVSIIFQRPTWRQILLWKQNMQAGSPELLCGNTSQQTQMQQFAELSQS